MQSFHLFPHLHVSALTSSIFRCSLRKGTFFGLSKLNLHQLVKFVILWLDYVELQVIEKYVRVAHQTAVDWANFCREVVHDAMYMKNEPIGGIDENGQRRVVEIDESKFGKRKFNKGHHVEGQWVSIILFFEPFLLDSIRSF